MPSVSVHVHTQCPVLVHTSTHTGDEKEHQLSEKQGDMEELIPRNSSRLKRRRGSDSDDSVVVYETGML